MTEPVEVPVLNLAYWVDHAPQLAQLLRGAAERGSATPIGDPSGSAPDPESIGSVVDPLYWSTHLLELSDVLVQASGENVAASGGSPLAVGARPNAPARLTFTVDEVAASLGISRAFAYESVHRGDIPSIRIGRRILVPKTALEKLVGEETSP